MVSDSDATDDSPQTRWTGGQFSVLRALTGLLIAFHFARLIPHVRAFQLESRERGDPGSSGLFEEGLAHDGWLLSPALGLPALVLGVFLAVTVGLGLRTRVAAIATGLLVIAVADESLTAAWAAPILVLLLLYCALQVPAPFGSLDARGRIDPGGNWSERPYIRAVLWVLVIFQIIGQIPGSLSRAVWSDGRALRQIFESPFARANFLNEWVLGLPDGVLTVMSWLLMLNSIAIVLLALAPRTRVYSWLGLVALCSLTLLAIDLPVRSIAALLFLLAMFDPAWLPAKRTSDARWVFYDGDCGLCHRLVRLILAEDRSEDAFRFAPLQSRAFETRVSESERANLPDSVAVLESSGTLLVRTAAVIQILEGLGGLWRIAALLLRVIPRSLADFGYDQIARVRKKVFAQPKGACPLVPPELVSRFELDT